MSPTNEQTDRRTNEQSNCPKKQGNASREYFEITQEQKEELGVLAVHLKGVSNSFNLHTFLLRRKKLKGFFPPADKVIKIGNHILDNKDLLSGSNLWAYFTQALKREEAQSFAEMNIKEHEQLKEDMQKPQLIRELINPALLERER